MDIADLSPETVFTIDRDASAAEAAELMHQETVGCLVVVDGGGRAVGILTDRDLCLRAVATPRADSARAPVHELMSAPVHTLEPDRSIDEATRLMRGTGVRRLPLCQDGRPVGMISLDDLVEVLSGALLDLETGSANRREDEARHRRSDRILQGLGSLRERVRAFGWQAREELLEDLDRLEDLLLRRSAGG